MTVVSVLGSWGPRLPSAAPLGDSALLIPRNFWFEAILGAGLGGLAVLVGALRWYASARVWCVVVVQRQFGDFLLGIFKYSLVTFGKEENQFLTILL